VELNIPFSSMRAAFNLVLGHNSLMERLMKSAFLLGGAVLALTAFAFAESASLAQPPPPAVKPVTESLWGQTVTDNYRYMEKLGPETIDWMKAQGSYTRALMDSIPGRAALGKRVAAFTSSFDAIEGYSTYGVRDFYEERQLGADNFDVMVKDAAGTRKIVDIEAVMKAHGGKPYAVNYFLPSPDGNKVAVGISEGGSEDASLFVYDAATGKLIAGPIDRARFGTSGWSDDSKIVFFNRLKKLTAGEPGTDKYKYSTADAWDLKSEPIVVSGPGVGSATMTPEVFPIVATALGGPEAILISINGVQNEWKIWTAPATDATSPKASWQLLFDRDADVTRLDTRGDDIFLLTHKDAPTYKVLALKYGEPMSAAKVLVAAEPDRVIEAIHAASDGLYVLARKGAYSELLRVLTGSTRIEEVALPTRGHIAEAFTDPRKPGIDIYLSSWVLAPTEYRYDPAAGKFADLKLGKHGDIDPANYTLGDFEAKASDGVMVPLSLIQPKDKPTPQIVVLEAYGSYGISNLADFSSRRAAMMKEGISYGVCHVRGGGEKGEVWRLGGKDANKHNTWQDVIACGEDLIARGITTKKKLFIVGGSAGGITMGRAMEEAPDLFAGVIDVVPLANTLRAEFSPNGPDNIPEFGTATNEQGFKNLYAMDSIQHAKKGSTYPAVLISTGLNDPRVSPWEPAKFAAAMMATGTPNPVLLRVDEQAGHGIGSTRSQSDALSADWIAFALWRAGQPDWQPTLKSH
jgi:prolyl oligopeptidase